MLDQHQLIADLEAEIDGLRDSAERCSKIDIVAKAAVGTGVALLLISFFWFSYTTGYLSGFLGWGTYVYGCGCEAARQPATDRDTSCRSFFHPWLLGRRAGTKRRPGTWERRLV